MPCSSFASGHSYPSPGPLQLCSSFPDGLNSITTGAALQHALFSVTVPGRWMIHTLFSASVATPAPTPMIQFSGNCGQCGSTCRTGICVCAAAIMTINRTALYMKFTPLLQLCDARVDVGERGLQLSLPRRMRCALERANDFLARQFQRFDLPRQFRILYGRPARLLAISLQLFHALLDPCFVVD